MFAMTTGYIISGGLGMILDLYSQFYLIIRDWDSHPAIRQEHFAC
jgi:hypothetical protein